MLVEVEVVLHRDQLHKVVMEVAVMPEHPLELVEGVIMVLLERQIAEEAVGEPVQVV
jgi:hypothetical protein